MCKLHIIQAVFGDCLLLEIGKKDEEKYILIDGGPKDNYENHLKERFQEYKKKGKSLDLVINSHVCGDHILGLIELLQDKNRIEINEIWFNSFTQSINSNADRFTDYLTIIQDIERLTDPDSYASNAYRDIDDGNNLLDLLDGTSIKLNQGFDGDLVSPESKNNPVEFGKAKLYVIGPNKTNLDDLKEKWETWGTRFEETHRLEVDEDALKAADDSIPNRSSIIILAIVNKMKILLTGDGLSQHIYDGLKELKLLDENKKYHVDILKLPHHGSHNNVTEDFFKVITADKYIVSASGKYGHPSIKTLKRLVKARKGDGKTIDIYVTNMTDSIEELQRDVPEEDNEYIIVPFDEGRIAKSINLKKE